MVTAQMPSPDSWLLIALYLALGFALLWWGATWLVEGASRFARGIGVSSLAVGLTVVAWGTSAPEVMVTMMAASKGTAELGLGNILGSNVANIGLVLGACALVLPKVLEGALARRETGWLFASVLTLMAVSWDWAITRTDSVVLLAVFGLHNLHLWRTSSVEPEDGERRRPTAGDVMRIVAGAGAIYFGCEAAIDGAVAGAARLGVSELVVGLTVVAVGTSLPELAAGLRSAAVGETEISLGNVVGSNVFNTLAVFGVVGLLHPLGDPAASETGIAPPPGTVEAAFRAALSTDFLVVLGFSVAVVVLTAVAPNRGGRAKGALLLVGWMAYTAYLYING